MVCFDLELAQAYTNMSMLLWKLWSVERGYPTSSSVGDKSVQLIRQTQQAIIFVGHMNQQVLSLSAYLASSLCWGYVAGWRNRNCCASAEEGKTTLSLLHDEMQRVGYAPASSITFYNGEAPVEYLKDKIYSILVSNPFLTARLVKPSIFSKEIFATFFDDPKKWNLSDYFSVVSDSTLSASMSYSELMEKVDKFQTKLGTQCINRNEPLFRVTLIRISSSTFAIVSFLNHVIGDGHTYYKINTMLGSASTPYALNPVRNMAFTEEIDSILDPNVIAMMESPLLVFGFIYNFLFYSPLKPHVYKLNESWISHEKAKYIAQNGRYAQDQKGAPRPSFISTNDILTSWFFQFVKCSYGGMVVNLRNRLKNYSDEMAGNYEKSVVYCADDAVAPELIRESLLGDVPRLRGRSSPEGYGHKLRLLSLNYAAVTSWASFYEDVEFPNCELNAHYPIMNMKWCGARHVLVVFKPKKSETAVVFWTGSVSRSSMNEEPILSQKLL